MDFIKCETKRKRYVQALKGATHVGKRTEIIYTKNEQSTRSKSFGCSSCTWYDSNVANEHLDDKTFYWTRDEFVQVLLDRGEEIPWANK